MNRRTRLAALAFGVLLVPLLACGVGETVTRTAFEATCVNECATSVDRALCQTYCECGYRYARDHEKLSELEHARVVPGQPMPPVLVELMSACGADIYDSNFRNECVRTCSQEQAAPVCTTRCDCFLRELRGPGARTESTRFLLENVEREPRTPAGQARLDTAERVCIPPS
jgi:hypothetical protein